MITKLEPTIKDYYWIISRIESEIDNTVNRDEYALYVCCESFISTFLLEVSTEKAFEILNKVIPCLSPDKQNDLVEKVFMILHRTSEVVAMTKVDVVIKDDLFDRVGVKVEKCSAYTEESDSCVRICGDVVCARDWDEDYRLVIKANLCNEKGEIVHIDYDFDRKTFLKIGYESFSINCYKGNNPDIKYVEVYPKLEKVKDGDDDD